jgi:hypothetical protein
MVDFNGGFAMSVIDSITGIFSSKQEAKRAAPAKAAPKKAPAKRLLRLSQQRP